MLNIIIGTGVRYSAEEHSIDQVKIKEALVKAKLRRSLEAFREVKLKTNMLELMILWVENNRLELFNLSFD